MIFFSSICLEGAGLLRCQYFRGVFSGLWMINFGIYTAVFYNICECIRLFYENKM